MPSYLSSILSIICGTQKWYIMEPECPSCSILQCRRQVDVDVYFLGWQLVLMLNTKLL